MLTWNEVFGGPVAQFPHTPMLQRGRSKGTLHVHTCVDKKFISFLFLN